jgi:hypothetical protein
MSNLVSTELLVSDEFQTLSATLLDVKKRKAAAKEAVEAAVSKFKVENAELDQEAQEAYAKWQSFVDQKATKKPSATT